MCFFYKHLSGVYVHEMCQMEWTVARGQYFQWCTIKSYCCNSHFKIIKADSNSVQETVCLFSVSVQISVQVSHRLSAHLGMC